MRPLTVKFAAAAAFMVAVAQSLTPLIANEPVAQKEAASKLEERTLAIDTLIAQTLHEQKQKPLPICDDETFVRRAHLDIVGRIPTLEETKAFLASKEPEKRRRLVDQLLDSPGYVSHQYNFWADILRIKDEDSAISRAFYVNWLKESLASNVPYDEFVRQLITAKGSGWQRGNGAVGYYLRDRGMPLDNIANTMRIFVGTRMACAQCHDHPNDRWTRREFFQLAAYTAGVVADNRNELFSQIYAREKTTQDEDLRAFSQYIRNTFHADKVLGVGEGQIHLPDDYQYSDAAPGEVVAAHPIFAPQRPDDGDQSGVGSRQQFAVWLTSPDNPRFTKVIANRLWKRAMVRGLVEPVDDFRDDTQASHPELLEYLTQLMKDLKFDQKEYLRVLYNTQTYQRATDPDEPEDGAPTYFRGRLLKRMTAEQAWDSLMTLVVPDIDTQNPQFYSSSIYYFDKPVLVGQDDMYSQFESVKDYTVDQHYEYLSEQLAKMKSDLAAQSSNEEASKQFGAGHGFYRRLRSAGVLARASELRSPAEPSHYLRIFGQSSRDLIETASTSANVTQFLAMFNGTIESELLHNSDSVLIKHLTEQESIARKCDVAFISILSRNASDDEKRNFEQMAGNSGAAESMRDLVWALLNTQEFIFVQ